MELELPYGHDDMLPDLVEIGAVKRDPEVLNIEPFGLHKDLTEDGESCLALKLQNKKEVLRDDSAEELDVLLIVIGGLEVNPQHKEQLGLGALRYGNCPRGHLVHNEHSGDILVEALLLFAIQRAALVYQLLAQLTAELSSLWKSKHAISPQGSR